MELRAFVFFAGVIVGAAVVALGLRLLSSGDRPAPVSATALFLVGALTILVCGESFARIWLTQLPEVFPTGVLNLNASPEPAR